MAQPTTPCELCGSPRVTKGRHTRRCPNPNCPKSQGKKTGLALLPKERLKKIASAGGKAAHEKNRRGGKGAHEWSKATRLEAIVNARKGGLAKAKKIQEAKREALQRSQANQAAGSGSEATGGAVPPAAEAGVQEVVQCVLRPDPGDGVGV